MYELARQHSLEHFVWGGVDYGSKLGGFAKKYRCGHLDGKNKVTGEFRPSHLMLLFTDVNRVPQISAHGSHGLVRPFKLSLHRHASRRRRLGPPKR
jgi:hypothetical protein